MRKERRRDMKGKMKNREEEMIKKEGEKKKKK